MRHDATAIFVLAFLVGSVAYGEMTSKIITAVRTKYPPVLDGFVTEAQWQTAPAALNFTQFDPIEGGLPTELTSVRMLYDVRCMLGLSATIRIPIRLFIS
jgi:hypothetical protein